MHDPKINFGSDHSWVMYVLVAAAEM